MNQLGLFELFTFVRLFLTFTLPVVLCTTLLLCFLYKHCTSAVSGDNLACVTIIIRCSVALRWGHYFGVTFGKRS